MPPKTKIEKEEIMKAAVELTRKGGSTAVNARALAAILNCSTQPIFSNFESMEDLKRALIQKAEELCSSFIQKEIAENKYPPYKASGMAYIRFAKEERELFKLLYMRDRKEEEQEPTSDLGQQMEKIVHSNTGLSPSAAKLFHLEMWACVHGIASMYATGFFEPEEELVSQMLTDTYQGLKKQYGIEV